MFMFYAIVSSWVWIWLAQHHWSLWVFQTVNLCISGEDYSGTISSGYTGRWQ